MKNLYIHQSFLAFEPMKFNEREWSRQEKNLYEKIKLADDRIAYAYDGSGLSFPRAWIHKKECLEAKEEVLIIDANQEPKKLRDCLKDQDEELTKVNITEKERRSVY